MVEIPKNWEQKGDYFHNKINPETHIGFESPSPNSDQKKAYLLVADGRGKIYLSKRAQSERNAKADAILYMRKHPNG